MNKLWIMLFSTTVVQIYGQDCFPEFTLADCNYNNNSVVDQVFLPQDIGFRQLCQDLCINNSECNYFTFNGEDGNCVLYHYFEFESCGLLSGPEEPDFYSCIPQPGSKKCKDFIEMNCTFLGDIMDVAEDIFYPLECQHRLQLLGNALGASYFVYDYYTDICNLLANSKRACSGFAGPDYPNYSDTCVSTNGTSTTTSYLTTTTDEPSDDDNILIIGTGYDGRSPIASFEAWDVANGLQCGEIPDYPYKVTGAVGAFFNKSLMLCGGYDGAYYRSDCYTLDFEVMKWSQMESLPSPFAYASSVVLPNGRWWVTGGFNYNTGVRLETVLWDPETKQWENGVPLPRTMSDHCSSLINETHVFLYDAYAYAFDWKNNVYTELPTPIETDSRSTCDNLPEDENLILVYSGYGTVQIYDSIKDKWSLGATLNDNRENPVITRHKDQLILAGGKHSLTFYDDVYALQNQTVWVQQQFNLVTAREYGIGISVPNHLISGCF